MTNWVEYWCNDKELVTIVGSYVPREGDMVNVKLRKLWVLRKVIKVIHQIDKTDPNIKEKFMVTIQ